MKAWIANLMWDALLIFSARLHDWVFDPDRHARIRFNHRKRWWAYHQKAQATKDPNDDLRARAWQIEFDFKTPPEEAMVRGDLDPDARQLAMDAVERARAAKTGKDVYPCH